MIKRGTEKIKWEDFKNEDNACIEMREPENVTEKLKQLHEHYRNDSKTDALHTISKIMYSGEWNEVVKNKNSLPDGRGIMEVHYTDCGEDRKGEVEFYVGSFKNGLKNGKIFFFKATNLLDANADPAEKVQKKVYQIDYRVYEDNIEKDKAQSTKYKNEELKDLKVPGTGKEWSDQKFIDEQTAKLASYIAPPPADATAAATTNENVNATTTATQ